MLGLGFPQLILILAGICFMVAGVYGLAPSLVTARFTGRGASVAPPTQQSSQQARKQQKAERARQHAEQAKADATAKAAQARVEAAAQAERQRIEAEAKAEREQAEATRKADQARVDAETRRLEAEQKQILAAAKAERERVKTPEPMKMAPVPVSPTISKTTQKTTTARALEPAATFVPPAGSLRLAEFVAPAPQAVAAPEPAAAAENAMDPELVDELFAEMFALRSTVADLVGEVHQMRTEQKPRRFVIEELSS